MQAAFDTLAAERANALAVLKHNQTTVQNIVTSGIDAMRLLSQGVVVPKAVAKVDAPVAPIVTESELDDIIDIELNDDTTPIASSSSRKGKEPIRPTPPPKPISLTAALKRKEREPNVDKVQTNPALPVVKRRRIVQQRTKENFKSIISLAENGRGFKGVNASIGGDQTSFTCEHPEEDIAPVTFELVDVKLPLVCIVEETVTCSHCRKHFVEDTEITLTIDGKLRCHLCNNVGVLVAATYHYVGDLPMSWFNVDGVKIDSLAVRKNPRYIFIVGRKRQICEVCDRNDTPYIVDGVAECAYFHDV